MRESACSPLTGGYRVEQSLRVHLFTNRDQATSGISAHSDLLKTIEMSTLIFIYVRSLMQSHD